MSGDSTSSKNRAAYNRAVYRRRVERGLCTSCCQPKGDVNTNTCLACRTKEKELRAANRALGLCHCGQPRGAVLKECDSCVEQRRAKLKAWKDAGLCSHCGRVSVENKGRCDTCRGKRRTYTRSLRNRVLDHYGGECECCGVKDREFLHLDHINGDGAHHRRNVSQAMLPQWLISKNFPKDFQILCASCNLSKRTGRHCAHVRLSREAVARVPDEDYCLYVGG